MKDSLSTVFFFFGRNPAASLLSESMVSFDPLCGVEALVRARMAYRLLIGGGVPSVVKGAHPVGLFPSSS